VHLPAGNWYDFHTGVFAGNNTRIQVSAESLQDRIPLFVRKGAVIPMLSEAPRQTRDAIKGDLILRHYGKQAGSFDLYEDDAHSFDYQKGSFRIRRFEVSQNGALEEKTTGSGPALFGKVTAVKCMTPE
jgi:alpha-glucosidase (family GH31 glycosyl hydrolase)